MMIRQSQLCRRCVFIEHQILGYAFLVYIYAHPLPELDAFSDIDRTRSYVWTVCLQGLVASG